jgi:hypothetical protein
MCGTKICCVSKNDTQKTCHPIKNPIKKSNLSCLQFFAVLLGRKSHRLDGLIAQLETKLDALVERLHRLQRRVNVSDVLRLHIAGLVLHVRLNHAIANGLGNNELGVDGRVQLQLGGDGVERDLRVGQAHHFHARLYHIVAQSDDQGPRVLPDEILAESLQHLIEASQVACVINEKLIKK